MGLEKGVVSRQGFLLVSVKEERPLISSCQRKGMNECIHSCWNTREKGNWPPWSCAGEELMLQEEMSFREEMKEVLSACDVGKRHEPLRWEHLPTFALSWEGFGEQLPGPSWLTGVVFPRFLSHYSPWHIIVLLSSSTACDSSASSLEIMSGLGNWYPVEEGDS